MRIKHIRLINFRNYSSATVELSPGKNIFIGENAQGKTNFLEAIEIASTGHSSRATRDNELIRWGQDNFRIHVDYEKAGAEESIALALNALSSALGGVKLEKRLKLNGGVLRNSYRTLLGKIIAVSFSSQDLNLLRGGPKFRREWLDAVILRVKPAYQTVLASYVKVVAQRNRFLKELAEKGRVMVQDQGALSAWDQQLVRFAVPMIRQRIKVLNELLPLAQKYLLQISGHGDSLNAHYLFNTGESRSFDQPTFEEEYPSISEMINLDNSPVETAGKFDLNAMSEEELSSMLLALLKNRRSIDMLRRHTLIGPHRDDITFSVNSSSATAFASQGQQRSLVLALKLAELDYITSSIEELPILLLDDVLAELDLGRQGALMSALSPNMQTVITTTHLAGFDPKWLENASIYRVQQGIISTE
jgi:DNA replication and repair protein RecF